MAAVKRRGGMLKSIVNKSRNATLKARNAAKKFTYPGNPEALEKYIKTHPKEVRVATEYSAIMQKRIKAAKKRGDCKTANSLAAGSQSASYIAKAAKLIAQKKQERQKPEKAANDKKGHHKKAGKEKTINF